MDRHAKLQSLKIKLLFILKKCVGTYQNVNKLLIFQHENEKKINLFLNYFFLRSGNLNTSIF